MTPCFLVGKLIPPRPGGYLDPSETDAAGLVTRLDEQLGIPKEHDGLGNQYHKGGNLSWYVKDCLSVWWRPNFDTFYVSVLLPLMRLVLSRSSPKYPYLPPHVSEPKEIKKLYLVELPPNSTSTTPAVKDAHTAETFAVPANMKLLAIPLMEFYDNAARYGPQFAGLPYVLGR
jgi:cleavage and polyadenylation specificity factor subunit 5